MPGSMKTTRPDGDHEGRPDRDRGDHEGSPLVRLPGGGDLVAFGGERVADLLKVAKHGSGEKVYLVEFHYEAHS